MQKIEAGGGGVPLAMLSRVGSLPGRCRPALALQERAQIRAIVLRTTQNMNLRILVETMRTLDDIVGTIRSSRLRKKMYPGHPLVQRWPPPKSAEIRIRKPEPFNLGLAIGSGRVTQLQGMKCD